MSTRYADRAFLTVNGAAVLDLQSATLRQNRNARATPSMTRDGFNRGFVQGNRDIDISAVVANLNRLPRAKLDFIDFENSDIGITWECGADQFVCGGVFLKDNEDSAGGVGDEVKATFNFGALTIVDSVGNVAEIFDIQL